MPKCHPNWNQSIPYSSSALVLDSNGVTYIAQQDVPAGTPLTDTSYWLDLDTDVPNLSHRLLLQLLPRIPLPFRPKLQIQMILRIKDRERGMCVEKSV